MDVFVSFSDIFVALFKDLIKELIVYEKKQKNLKKTKIVIKYINKRIVISNYGECSAKNIRVYIDDTPILEHKDFSVFARQIDFSLLTSQNSIGIKHLEYMGMPTNYKIKVIIKKTMKLKILWIFFNPK